MVSIIIVTYNSSGYIINCLKSISSQKDVDYEIIIVDNNSSDDTVKTIQDSDIEVKLLVQDENLGFSKANNIGVKSSKGDYLLFLNPDTEIMADTIPKLKDYLAGNSDVGIVAPMLKLPNGEIQPSVKNFPTVFGAVNEYLLGHKGSYEEYVPVGKVLTEVESVYGAALLIRKDLFNEVYGFDEKYFLYYEDIDLCRKVKQMGKKIIYYPSVQVIHEIGSSGKQLTRTRLPFGIRTLANFFPFRALGSYRYLVMSGNTYHGVVKAFFIRLIIYLGQKLNQKLA